MVDIKDTSTTISYSNPSLEEVKEYLINPPDSHNGLIDRLRIAAFQKIENVTGRSLTAHTYQFEVNGHDGEIYLLNSPINTISKVEYFDGDSWIELTSDDYDVLGLTEKTVVISLSYQRVRITYTTSAYDNANLRKIVMDLVQVWYDNRPDADNLEQVVVNKMSKFKVWQVE